MYDLETLHQSGLIPDRFYYQLNGKSAQHNYNRITLNRGKSKEGFVFALVKSLLYATAKTALDEILKELK